jgi:hypothetical protein
MNSLEPTGKKQKAVEEQILNCLDDPCFQEKLKNLSESPF